MKFLCLISGFLLISIHTSGLGNDTIFWSSNRLQFDDFRIKTINDDFSGSLSMNKNTVLEGYIFSGITFSLLQEESRFTCEVKAYMIPEESWLKNKNDSATLAHEQAHFDITEIYARRLRSDLSKVKSAAAARKMMDANFAALQAEQKKFDRSHKQESGVEDFWKNKIETGLRESDKWINPVVICGIPSAR
jgi:hypothetical protein